MNLRWNQGSHAFRTGRIDPTRYDVAPIPDDTTARNFVTMHHYSRSYPAARRRFGLYSGGNLVGVAVYSVPCHPQVLGRYFDPASSLELGRLVLLDSVPGNGESWFVARTFELLRAEGFQGVVSFSDPVPRTAVDGRPVFPGHWGCVYQALNAVLSGRSTARRLRLLADGRVFSDRALAKIRARDRGWEYAARLLVEQGAEAPGEDTAAWLRAWLPRLTRPLDHPGNHRYLFALDRRVRRTLPASDPYPKAVDAA
jgi:hypothetical protein